MEIKSIADINQYVGISINPLNTPDTVYELYSVPSFDLQYPEIIKGSEIGSTKVTVEEGDVLICKINPRINRVWIVKRHPNYTLLASSEWIVVRNRELDSNYLKWYFSSPPFRQLMVSQVAGIGGSLTRAQPKQVAKYLVPLPTFDEQRQISTVLDKLTDLIFFRKQQLTKLEELVKARFVEMFGESRINPKGWEIIQLEKIAEVGSSKRVFVEELQEQGVPFYRGTEIGALAEDKNVIPELFITEEHYQSLCEATGTPAVGDLLMPSICPDGRIWLVDNDKPFYFKDGRVLWIHPTNRQIDSCYLLYVLKEKIMTDYESIASGATFVELKIFALKALAIMLPPIEQQQQFSAFIAVIKKQRLTIQKSLDKLETLKNSLMQQYFG